MKTITLETALQIWQAFLERRVDMERSEVMGALMEALSFEDATRFLDIRGKQLIKICTADQSSKS
jgi:hypothetical protein